MNNIDLDLDAILYRKLEIIAALKGQSVCDYLTNFFGCEVSTPSAALIPPVGDSFCR